MGSLNTRLRRRELGLCERCGKRKPYKSFLACKKCIDKNIEAGRVYYASQRQTVLKHYGNKCNCCGESNPMFLTLDHINNDGAAHRKKVFGQNRTTGSGMYGWLIKNNFPPGFQLLCMNCNWGKQMNGGVCPHKTRRRK